MYNFNYKDNPPEEIFIFTGGNFFASFFIQRFLLPSCAFLVGILQLYVGMFHLSIDMMLFANIFVDIQHYNAYNELRKEVMTLNERLKLLRKALHLTQQEFADRLGISRGNIAAYEVAKNAPSDAVILLICKEFNVSEIWLRTGEGEMFTPNPATELDALKERYGLSQAECSLIDVFVNMNEKDRKTVLDFVVHAADSIRENDLFFGVPETPEELEAKYPPVRAIKKNVG